MQIANSMRIAPLQEAKLSLEAVLKVHGYSGLSFNSSRIFLIKFFVMFGIL